MMKEKKGTAGDIFLFSEVPLWAALPTRKKKKAESPVAAGWSAAEKVEPKMDQPGGSSPP